MSESEDPLAFIPTRSSMLNNKSQENYKAVTYHSYKKKSNQSTKATTAEKEREGFQGDHFNIKRAKYEVVKFGMSGFDPQKKEEAKVQLAIRLGAKPPKNKYKNYKLLLEERKTEKDVTKSRLEFQQLGKNQIGKSTAKGKRFDRKKKQKDDPLESYGKAKFKSKPNK